MASSYTTTRGNTYANVDDYIKKTGTVVSDADRALIDANPDFAQIFYNQKDAWHTGNDQQKKDANTALNDARAYYGGYTGGQTGTQTETLSASWPKMASQLQGRADNVQRATDAQVRLQRANIERARADAQQQIKDNTAGYFAGLAAQNEAAANQGWNPMGGQSRTERARALSQMQAQQNQIQSDLRNTEAQYEAAIASLVANGEYQQAQMVLENLNALRDEFSNMYSRDYGNRQLAENQRQFNATLAESQREREMSRAMELFQMGIPADESISEILSVPVGSTIYDYIPKTTYSGGGTGSSKNSIGSTYGYIKDRYSMEEARNLYYRYLNGEDLSIDEMRAMEAYGLIPESTFTDSGIYPDELTNYTVLPSENVNRTRQLSSMINTGEDWTAPDRYRKNLGGVQQEAQAIASATGKDAAAAYLANAVSGGLASIDEAAEIGTRLGILD